MSFLVDFVLLVAAGYLLVGVVVLAFCWCYDVAKGAEGFCWRSDLAVAAYVILAWPKALGMILNDVREHD